jgi:hypothetical protein
MIATTAYILISTLTINYKSTVTQSTATFADKASCESAVTRQDFIYKDMRINGKWNLTCYPYQLSEVKHEPSK